MENSIKNREMFMALYWGQNVVNFGSDKLIVDGKLYRVYDILECYLELKPLSSITDEDAITIYRKVLYTKGHHDYHKLKKTDEIKQGKACALSCLYLKGGYCGFGAGTGQWVSDYLRSKGYALPFMGLSVEKLVEYGWVKLKTEV